MLRLHHNAYTRKDLADLWKRQRALPHEVELKRNVLGEHVAELTRMQLGLGAFDTNEIVPKQKKIDELQARIDALTLPDKITRMDEEIAVITKKLAEASQKKTTLTQELKPVAEQLAKLETAEKSLEGRELIVLKQAELAALVQETASRHEEYGALHSQQAVAIEEEQTLKARLEKEPAVELEWKAAHEKAEQLDEVLQRLDQEIKSKEDSARKLTFHVQEFASELDGYARKLIGFKYTENLPALRELIRQQKIKKESLDKQLAAANQIHSQMDERARLLDRDRGTAQARLEKARPLSLPHRDKFNIPELEKQIAGIKKQIESVEKNRSELERAIEKQLKIIEADEEEIKSKNTLLQIIENNKFAKEMRDTPASKVEELRLRLGPALRQYELDHPETADLSVRSCLLRLEDKFNFILQQPGSPGVDQASYYRKQYCQLSGVLWDAHHATVDKGVEFAVMLEQVLGENVIQDADAISVYKELKDHHKDALRDVSEQEIKLFDEAEFAKASENFNKALKAIPRKASRAEKNYYRKGEALLAAILAQKKATEKRGRFDLKLHTEILNVAALLLENKEDETLCDRLSDLSKHKLDGQYSVAKNVVGAIAAFIGAVLMVVSGVAMGGLLPGISWPIAGGLVAGGATLFGSGIALCTNGRKKGTTKAIEGFEAGRLNVTKSNLSRFMDYIIRSPSPAPKRKKDKNDAAIVSVMKK